MTPEKLKVLNDDLIAKSKAWGEADDAITAELIASLTSEQLVPYFEAREVASKAYREASAHLRAAQRAYLNGDHGTA